MTMNRDLEDLDAWLKGNKLSVNVVKTAKVKNGRNFIFQASEGCGGQLHYNLTP